MPFARKVIRALFDSLISKLQHDHGRVSLTGFRQHSRGMGANYAWGGYRSWVLKETWLLFVQVIYGAYIHARIDHRAA